MSQYGTLYQSTPRAADADDVPDGLSEAAASPGTRILGTVPQRDSSSVFDHEPGESPLARIRGALPELTGAVRAGAEYILANAWEVKGLSIHEVAARVGVSAHALNRLAHRVGYVGYRDFSKSLMLELGRVLGAAYAIPQPLVKELSTADGRPSTLASLASRVFGLEAAALQDTLRTLDVDAFERAVHALAGAESILFVATGAGLGAIAIAAYRLRVLGIRAATTGDPASIASEIYLLRRGDVVVAVSYHGSSPIGVEAMERARSRGLTGICITAVPRSAVAKRADISLLVCSPEEAVSVGHFSSRVTTMVLLESLATGVAWMRRDTCLPHAKEVMREAQTSFEPPTRRARRSRE